MKTKHANELGLPAIVDRVQWEAALAGLLAKEKEATRASDQLAAARRRLPMVKIDKSYEFQSPTGPATLFDLFDGRRQLIIYHFMFAPGVNGWPTAGCPGCSWVVDQIGHLAHLHARDTSLCIVARAPLANIERFKDRMGWTIPWVSSAGTDFNLDFGVTTDKGEMPGLSILLQDDERVFRTYFTTGRGLEALGSLWTFLDLTPLGRQEEWEDTPIGRPQSAPYTWWRRHDEYENKLGGSRS